MKTSGVVGSRVLLRLKKVTATSNSKQTTHSQSKPPSPEYSGTCRSKTKKGLDGRRNKRSGIVLYVLQTAFCRKL